MRLTESVQNLVTTFISDLRRLIGDAPLSDLVATEAVETIMPDQPPPASRPRVSNPAVARAPRKAATKTKSGRLARRSPEQIKEAAAEVAGLLKSNKDGLRSEQIRTTLDMDVREVPRVLKQAMADGLIKILSGQKRSTVYGAGRGTARTARKAPRKAARKAAPKKARKAKPARKAARKPARKPLVRLGDSLRPKARKPAVTAKKRPRKAPAKKAPAVASTAEPKAA